jgi:hypothetical protein
MTYFIFNTGGDWDSTTLFLNGQEFQASRLYLQLTTGRNDYGEPCRGGLRNGGDMTAYVMPQDDSQGEYAIFPGRIDLEFPMHKLTVENASPQFAIEFTRVMMDNEDITDRIVDLQVDIDAVANNATAYLSLYRPHLLGADEVASFNLIG